MAESKIALRGLEALPAEPTRTVDGLYLQSYFEARKRELDLEHVELLRDKSNAADFAGMRAFGDKQLAASKYEARTEELKARGMTPLSDEDYEVWCYALPMPYRSDLVEDERKELGRRPTGKRRVLEHERVGEREHEIAFITLARTLKSYDYEGDVPLIVLERMNDFGALFDSVEIRTPEEQPIEIEKVWLYNKADTDKFLARERRREMFRDPILVGTVEGPGDTKDRYLLARWGESVEDLIPWDELKEMHRVDKLVDSSVPFLENKQEKPRKYGPLAYLRYFGQLAHLRMDRPPSGVYITLMAVLSVAGFLLGEIIF